MMRVALLALVNSVAPSGKLSIVDVATKHNATKVFPSPMESASRPPVEGAVSVVSAGLGCDVVELQP